VKKRGPKIGGLYDLDDLLIFLTLLPDSARGAYSAPADSLAVY